VRRIALGLSHVGIYDLLSNTHYLHEGRHYVSDARRTRTYDFQFHIFILYAE